VRLFGGCLATLLDKASARENQDRWEPLRIAETTVVIVAWRFWDQREQERWARTSAYVGAEGAVFAGILLIVGRRALDAAWPR
jgi:hypothetical protein